MDKVLVKNPVPLSAYQYSWENVSFCMAPASPPASVQVTNRKVQSVQAGGNVTFSCRSVTKEDVIQVTWQKETDGTEDNIATYSTINGQKIAKAYVSHVSFAHSELQASAISLHGVTLQDEGCYKCIFNTFPSGAVTGRMCLKVYGKAL
uniref:Ig-like domain-containing protein n=1 Tax=Junco hyemalis TaxID=40217 RepID=A0A8C5JS62_JUNHY